jgi:acyl-CoA thioester hydrolase
MMAKHNIGPAVFNEHIHFFKESVQGKIRVSFELGGASEDGMFFKFIHNFYDESGKNLAYAEMKGGWMDLNERKLIPLPKEMLVGIRNAPKSDDFMVLTKKDMRVPGISPKDL